MLIGSNVPITNNATSARIATHSGPMILFLTPGAGERAGYRVAHWPSQ